MIINLLPLEPSTKTMYNYSAGSIALKMNKLFPKSCTKSTVVNHSFAASVTRAQINNMYNTYSTDLMELLHYVIVLDIVAEEYGFSSLCDWMSWKFVKAGKLPV